MEKDKIKEEIKRLLESQEKSEIVSEWEVALENTYNEYRSVAFNVVEINKEEIDIKENNEFTVNNVYIECMLRPYMFAGELSGKDEGFLDEDGECFAFVSGKIEYSSDNKHIVGIYDLEIEIKDNCMKMEDNQEISEKEKLKKFIVERERNNNTEKIDEHRYFSKSEKDKNKDKISYQKEYKFGARIPLGNTLYNGRIISKEEKHQELIKKAKYNYLCYDLCSWDEIVYDIENNITDVNEQEKWFDEFTKANSSNALCVNNFALFKKFKNKISFCGYNNFNEVKFEKIMPSGLQAKKHPQIDFYLENQKVIIAIESKYTEHFESKIEHTNKNLSIYLKYFGKNLSHLPKSFIKLIEHYNTNEELMYLDVAQLIKHSIGLINESKKKEKKAILVYIYWEPINWDEIESCKQHRNEVVEFSNRVKEFENIITFKSLSYRDFWKMYENCELMKEYIKIIRDRYDFEYDERITENLLKY